MPPTSAEAALRARLARGPLPFAEFMAEALYGQAGYYRREVLPIGEDGDYVTGSSLSPLFGRATGRLLRRLDAVLGRPADLLEAGYGSGAHLAAVLGYLGESQGCLGDGEGAAGAGAGRVGEGVGDPGKGEAGEAGGGPAGREPDAREASASGDAPRRGRRVLAWDQAARPLPPGARRVGDLEEVPEGSLDGLVFSYELFDALPVHRLIGRADGSVGEIWVALDESGAFTWQEGDLSAPALAGLLRAPDAGAPDAASPPGRRAARAPGPAPAPAPGQDVLAPGKAALAPGQVADLSPGWAPLYRRLARRLGRGLVVTCDYGFERSRLLDPRARPHGTLACYSRQRVHRNPFVLVGEQDLTAHVDFTALRQAGEEEGLATLAFTRQALWLAACGLFDDLPEAGPEERQQAMALLDGEGMGEEIRVLVQGRGVELERLLGPERAALLAAR